MAKYLDETGLSHFWGKLKTAFAAATHTHSASDVTSGTLSSARIPIAGTDIGGVKNGGDVYIDSAGTVFYDLGTELDTLAASRAEDYDVAQGAMYYNGTGSVAVNYLPIDCGGTGADNAADARANLGITDTPKTVWFGSCSTTASTAAKVVTCSGFTLTTGAIIGVSFSTANTAATPTLNVNSTGAKSIWIGTSTPNSTTNSLKWSAYTMLYFMYDGSEYRFITAVSAGSVVPRGANTWYATCSTAADTAAKAGACANFVLTKGALVSVTFTYANTATTPTLNVNSTGAKSIYASNAAGSASNPITWDAKDTLTFIYSGSYFYLVARDSVSKTNLPTATSTTLGGVMVGSGLNINDGVLSTVFPGVSYETSEDGWSIYEIGSVKICTKTITGSLAVTTSYSGRYISALQSVTFPSEYLQKVVYADVVAASSPGIFWTAKTAISNTSMSYYVVANTSLTQNVTRRLIAIGAY